MRLTADTHVHIYPEYDIQLALHNLRRNLSQLDSQATCLAFLAERSDCNFFADFEKNGAQVLGAEAEVRYLESALHIKEKNYPDLYIFPGRQIITRERIEILALTVDKQIPEGLAASEVVKRIHQENGVPVLSWAPGKWFFKRKRVVQDLLDASRPGSLLIGDTTLRPTCWFRPLLMRQAAQKGLTVISGSDPLPFAGEEEVMGRYGIQFACDLDSTNPVSSIRSVLTRPGWQPSLRGKRGHLLPTLRRLFKNNRSKKR
ncbi:hypothetical protein UWK_00475 [Desulfocapsa sulfexigens DSM 10523]|uniref:Amidohydrolase-related domain-containing protein n=1 Tax=Desulfocapsa sulfexigens (strain DSM 10523 / SB164P1) TaxID=1167006 RepID=M1P0M9_DESSD|nr:hypothetical protein [Desulfocapsa sulfexigens]AGF77058.1 hypothetical protein UWK_00475 [Desulfocapsa sulfexigens DSM 10523]